MGMREKMKEKRIPLTSAQKSQKVIKSISRGDSEELKYSMRLIIEQNRAVVGNDIANVVKERLS